MDFIFALVEMKFINGCSLEWLKPMYRGDPIGNHEMIYDFPKLIKYFLYSLTN